ncbi:MAG: hypothetical protein AVDCRST_MAG88-848 [uncultured Thermomicrobiales bacterium]|uniref:Uncharacterized protein n=1 Tax=uncultured Thermomicrobiales bacterium TaxID=1645740 RepID=A0A6J4UJ67_9BACT|nr:MAG: hypothetical protein AVDCRST_MAG88-848 [uncultured Thermomicrobiales bacterium]
MGGDGASMKPYTGQVSRLSTSWSGHPWALPVLTAPALTPATSARLGQRHHTTVDRARTLL